MTTISLKVPESLAREVALEARRRGVSKSAWVREALERAAKEGRRKKKLSCLELAGDLVGSLRGGPSDLSSNPKYMEDFGK